MGHRGTEGYVTAALFYPCCGSSDLATAVDGFCHLTSSVHGADPTRGVDRGIKSSWRLQGLGSTKHSFTPEIEPNCRGGIRHIERGVRIPDAGTRHDYIATSVVDAVSIPFTWHQYDAIEALNHIGSIGVFFFRRDRPEDGEGSSGIRWLDDILLQRVLAKLVHGGLVVTDGAGMKGAAKQAPLWTAREMIDPVGASFDAFGRHFVCGSVFCPMERPTLVWHVS